MIEFHQDQRVELYDLGNDPEESKDLAASKPTIRDDLRSRLYRWRKDAGAQMPVVNEKFNAEREGMTAAQAKAKGLL